ncbi:S66 peptidase family protein [Clostridium sp. 'White wine YQ']|uniref:S66 peptidase family protein n=1 Tax=Clostridium sp. 'White wine YQ' TaxID=3027474 RepID=UPI0023662365|nr:LD-carboxypeptidase [Clostridium sp. 'White wine YQ']MDD7794751.1 LD-carboxypeptidase [Clostridium sp. 'White wine YQ']
MVKPKTLKKGDTVGIVSPATGLDRSHIWRAIRTFESWGLKVKVGKHAYDNYYYLAGTDEARAEDVNEFFADSSINAIFCSQGGYGSPRIVNALDYDMIRKNPKIFIGYSDITALHLAIYKKTGLTTFHGPSATGIYGEYATEYRLKYLYKALFSGEPIGQIKMADPDKYLVKVTKGRAYGKTIGGNLSLICELIGTPYEIDTKGKILFFEEVGSDITDIDSRLTQLLNTGKLQSVAGIVIGECTDCETDVYDKGRSLENLIFERIGNLGIPAIWGLPIGHTHDLATIPIGVNAFLDASKGEFSILETATL